MHPVSSGESLLKLRVAEQLPEPNEDLGYAESLMETAGGFRSAIVVRNRGPFRGELL